MELIYFVYLSKFVPVFSIFTFTITEATIEVLGNLFNTEFFSAGWSDNVISPSVFRNCLLVFLR